MCCMKSSSTLAFPGEKKQILYKPKVKLCFDFGGRLLWTSFLFRSLALWSKKMNLCRLADMPTPSKLGTTKLECFWTDRGTPLVMIGESLSDPVLHIWEGRTRNANVALTVVQCSDSLALTALRHCSLTSNCWHLRFVASDMWLPSREFTLPGSSPQAEIDGCWGTNIPAP